MYETKHSISAEASLALGIEKLFLPGLSFGMTLVFGYPSMRFSPFSFAFYFTCDLA